jgi:hypothetical protein
MSVQMVLLPLIAQVLLTFFVGFVMAFRARQAFAGGLRWQDLVSGKKQMPAFAAQASRAYTNLLELPVLFYVLVVLALLTRQADILFVVLAWTFVVARALQAYVHVTSNHVPTRGAFFGIGALVLFVMWLIYIVRILSLPWA